jgi:hypothetical protein
MYLTHYKYLTPHGEFLGNVERERVEQIGKNIERHRQAFQLI